MAGTSSASPTARRWSATSWSGALITEADGALHPRVINTLPIEHRWERVPGVTLLGNAIAAHPGDIEAALTAYEKDLYPRSAPAAREAADNLALCFADNAPHSLVDRFAAYADAR
jgi:hypothetical protein